MQLFDGEEEIENVRAVLPPDELEGHHLRLQIPLGALDQIKASDALRVRLDDGREYPLHLSQAPDTIPTPRREYVPIVGVVGDRNAGL